MYCIGLAAAFFFFTRFVDIDDKGHIVLMRGQKASKKKIEAQGTKNQPAKTPQESS